jgi:hypothetical protein
MYLLLRKLGSLGENSPPTRNTKGEELLLMHRPNLPVNQLVKCPLMVAPGIPYS